MPHNGFGFERNSGKGSFFHTINLHRTAVFSTVGCQATSIALTDSNRLSRIKVSYIFDLSIIGRNAMVGVMEWCSKANHEVPNFKHQTGAPPAGWGLRRRNLRVFGFRCQCFPLPLRFNRFQLLDFFFLTPPSALKP